MRNSKNKARCVKKKLNKCIEVCRTFTPLQQAYAEKLDGEETVKEFRCNVPLHDFSIEGGPYTTDFFITRTNGEIAIRECVVRKHIVKPMQIKLLDASREYWMRIGVKDWGIVTNEEN